METWKSVGCPLPTKLLIWLHNTRSRKRSSCPPIPLLTQLGPRVASGITRNFNSEPFRNIITGMCRCRNKLGLWVCLSFVYLGCIRMNLMFLCHYVRPGRFWHQKNGREFTSVFFPHCTEIAVLKSTTAVKIELWKVWLERLLSNVLLVSLTGQNDLKHKVFWWKIFATRKSMPLKQEHLVFCLIQLNSRWYEVAAEGHRFTHAWDWETRGEDYTPCVRQRISWGLPFRRKKNPGYRGFYSSVKFRFIDDV